MMEEKILAALPADILASSRFLTTFIKHNNTNPDNKEKGIQKNEGIDSAIKIYQFCSDI